MRVWLQPNKMAALGITPEDIANAIREQNAQTPAGVMAPNPPRPARKNNITCARWGC